MISNLGPELTAWNTQKDPGPMLIFRKGEVPNFQIFVQQSTCCMAAVVGKGCSLGALRLEPGQVHLKGRRLELSAKYLHGNGVC